MPGIKSDLVNHSIAPEFFENALKKILRATVGKLGENFLHGLIKAFCETLKLDYAVIGRWEEKMEAIVHSIAVYGNGCSQDNFKYDVKNSPLESAFKNAHSYTISKALTHFPQDLFINETKSNGYVAVKLTDTKGQIIGVLFAVSRQPIENSFLVSSIFEIFSFRVAAELERQSITQNLENEVKINQAQLDSVPALMFMLNRKGKFLRWNQYFHSKFGYSESEIPRKNVLSTIHESERKRVEIEIEKVFSVGSGAIYVNGITKDGTIVPMLATVEATTYDDEPVIVGVALDMTEQQNVERNLLRSQGRLARKNSQLSLINALVNKLHASYSVKHIAQQVVELLQTIQENSSIVFCHVIKSDAMVEVIADSGVSQSLINSSRKFPFIVDGSPTGIAMQSQKLEVFPSLRDDDRVAARLKVVFKKEGIKAGIVLPLVYQKVVLGSINIGYKYYSDIPESEIEFYQTIGTSISLALANARQYELMESLATRDNLTGLPNRNALNEDCRLALQKNAQFGSFLGLILIDLDRFKEINDTLDHLIGDKLLKLIGPGINRKIQDSDCKVYRLGGDEFCVLVSNKQNAKDVLIIAEEIKQAIAQPFDVDGLNLEISSSVGVVTTNEVRHSATEMLRCAELAMYHIKNKGGGVEQYTPELDADTNQRFVIMSEMAEAIRTDQMVLHYQPKLDLKSKKIIGCEALVRWQHKKYGLLLPEKFIPLIELTQLIHPLTFWVMKTAMKQMQFWKKQGMKLRVAVNLSSRNITDNNFIGEVDELMRQFKLSADEIEFEVTETAIMQDIDKAMSQLNKFSKRGIQCSLDDYGTGYSSLTYVKKLPLDILKIDRSFVSKMVDNDQDRIIAKSTINLAHNLGLKVVAEGVEDSKTLQELTAQGCDQIQGYYIGKPLVAEEFEKLYWQYAGS